MVDTKSDKIQMTRVVVDVVVVVVVVVVVDVVVVVVVSLKSLLDNVVAWDCENEFAAAQVQLRLFSFRAILFRLKLCQMIFLMWCVICNDKKRRICAK